MNDNSSIKIEFIKYLLRFYSVNAISNIKISGNKIYGKAIWRDIPNDEDYQNFVWDCMLSEEEIESLIEILEYIYKNDYYKNDKILIKDDKIYHAFKEKWKPDKIRKTINNMYNVEIEMIDEEGCLNDAFYLHR